MPISSERLAVVIPDADIVERALLTSDGHIPQEIRRDASGHGTWSNQAEHYAAELVGSKGIIKVDKIMPRQVPQSTYLMKPFPASEAKLQPGFFWQDFSQDFIAITIQTLRNVQSHEVDRIPSLNDQLAQAATLRLMIYLDALDQREINYLNVLKR